MPQATLFHWLCNAFRALSLDIDIILIKNTRSRYRIGPRRHYGGRYSAEASGRDTSRLL
jgi:hypothetical protein